VVAPIGLGREGLPIGLQVNGRPFDEETVLAVARMVEHEPATTNARRGEDFGSAA
jgi:aspartyl-tRNA(Asn)/glutamyl-tRNA(Gln) amidotransferase subunit A